MRNEMKNGKRMRKRKIYIRNEEEKGEKNSTTTHFFFIFFDSMRDNTVFHRRILLCIELIWWWNVGRDTVSLASGRTGFLEGKTRKRNVLNTHVQRTRPPDKACSCLVEERDLFRWLFVFRCHGRVRRWSDPIARLRQRLKQKKESRAFFWW